MLVILLPLLFGLIQADDVRMDCHPEPDADKTKCEKRGCIWGPSASVEAALEKNNGPANPWGEDFKKITISSNYIGKTLNVKIGVKGR
ncbi:unnamed protein product [Strongylus vulgaris]|uniref:P-type domain-containing protein n=1 Tax=Strongylus vulgaris TaxID=40348 RepID=A0A3P7IEM9_STRVU|nr:unnamed protein product [Strongylus vulgaris]